MRERAWAGMDDNRDNLSARTCTDITSLDLWPGGSTLLRALAIKPTAAATRLHVLLLIKLSFASPFKRYRRGIGLHPHACLIFVHVSFMRFVRVHSRVVQYIVRNRARYRLEKSKAQLGSGAAETLLEKS